mmetsp:Transcript_63203/g.137455  ORF Transcript_63203/g.137455 Transcript_63203/m.137455 type:complete len:300 (+) Transcript_63203:395-1294(+)
MGKGPQVTQCLFVVRATLEADGALGDGWKHLFPLQDARSVLFHVHPLEASQGKQGSVNVTRLELPESRLHIAPKVHAGDTRVHGVDLRLASQRRCPNDASLGEICNFGHFSILADEDIACVFAGQHRAELCVRNQISGDVLRGMNAKIHLLGRQGHIELPGEKAFSADGCKGNLQTLVPRGGDDADIHGIVRCKLRESLRQALLGLVSLSQRQRRATRAHPQDWHLGCCLRACCKRNRAGSRSERCSFRAASQGAALAHPTSDQGEQRGRERGAGSHSSSRLKVGMGLCLRCSASQQAL